MVSVSSIFISFVINYLIDKGVEHMKLSLEFHGKPMPEESLSLRVATSKLIFRRILSNMFPKGSVDQHLSTCEELIVTYLTLSKLYTSSQKIQAAYYSCLAATEIAEMVRHPSQLAKCYAQLGKLYVIFNSHQK